MDLALTEAVKAKFVALDPLFDERLRRCWAAVEARGIGRGGIARVAAATGMSRTTIRAGLKELAGKQAGGAGPESVRRPGAGRKPCTHVHPPPGPGAATIKMRVRQANWRRGKGESPWKEG